jgi:hypothetical protein
LFNTIATLILCHVFGDYFLQTPYIAAYKTKSYYGLLVHCLLYIIPFIVIFGFQWWLLTIFVLHIYVDYLKARGLIGDVFDQVAHYLVLGVYFL